MKPFSGEQVVFTQREAETEITALRAELAQVRVENARLELWNDAVAVCEKHTGRIIASGCYVCVADAFEEENTALRARIAELEAALMEYGMHAYDENGEPCYGDQLTRCVDEDGNAEKYACTCGFSAALAGKQP